MRGMATTLDPTRRAAIPGPKGHWLKGNLPEFAPDRLGFLTRIARDHGDVVAIRFLHRKILVVNHPDLVEEVLVTRNRSFIKHFALRIAKSTMGEGLLTSEGDFWRRQRRLSQPAFHREKVAGHAGVMVEHAERMLAGWSDGQRLDVQEAMMRLTLEIVAKCLFDADVSVDSADASEAMETVLQCFTARVNKVVPLPTFVPTPTNLRLKRAMKRLDGIIYRVIADRRATVEDRGDLLSMLLQATDPVEEGGAGMTDRQLRDEAMTLFMAGHETTANTLAWIWLLLSTHPEVESKLHDELDEVLADRPPSFDDLPRLAYAEKVVTEALASTRPSGSSAVRRSSRPRSAATRSRSARPSTCRSGSSTATLASSTTRSPTVPIAGTAAWRRRSRVMPISRSGAARGSASATRSP